MPSIVPFGVWALQAGATPGRWVADRLPLMLQGHGPFGLEWWQWVALPALVLARKHAVGVKEWGY